MISVPERVLAAWTSLEVEPVPFGSGLINTTLRGTLEGRAIVLQRLHPVFGPSVHEDIEAITSHLAERGRETPRLCRTRDGSLYALDDDGRPWRAQSLVPDAQSFDKLSPEQVFEAGRLVGDFHLALSDLEHRYAHVRPGVHDLPYRRRALHTAVEAHSEHRLHRDVVELCRRVEALERSTVTPAGLPLRHAHGDLKASNLLFDRDSGRGRCLVDLDTLAAMVWPFELGDALRSWCNPHGEDVLDASVDAEAFRAALAGYAEGARDLDLQSAEHGLAARGVLTIALELAMRFLTDALEERYFGFDATRFERRGEHNLLRARGQLALAEDVGRRLDELEELTARAFGLRSTRR